MPMPRRPAATRVQGSDESSGHQQLKGLDGLAIGADADTETAKPADTALPADTASDLVVFTDGSCLGNPGRGGWAWIVPGGPFASGAEPKTTNQRMEITAVLEALRSIDEPLTIASDSAYVVNCFEQRWYEGWKRRGWRNSQGAPIANQDLWEPLLALALDPARKVKFRKVRGHSGDAMNELVDRLAVEAATTGEGRSGSGPIE
ncbi:MAG: ribonuclease H [Acidimicrobiales bacterium]